MRKNIIFLIVTIFTCFVFSNITVWFSWEGYDVFKEMIEDFKKNTGVRVEIYNVRKIDQKLIATLKASKKLLPDIVLLKNDQIAFFENELETFNVNLKGISEKSIKAFTIDGKLKAIPFYFDIGGVIFYNPQLIDDPSGKSFEELLELGEKCGGKYGFMIPVYGTSFFQVFQRTFGKREVVGKKPIFTDEATRKALEFLEWILKKTGRISMDRYGQMTAFREGKAPLFMFGSFLIPSFEGHVEYGIVEIPEIERAGKKLVPYLDYKGFAVIKGRMREEVRRFLEFVISKSVQREFCKRLFKFPVYDDVMRELSNENEIFKRLKGYVVNGEPTPTSKLSGIYYQAVKGMLGLLIRGDYKNLDELIEKAQNFVDENVR